MNTMFVLTCVNHFLSTLPFLAAVDSGIMGISSDQATLLPPPLDQLRFCFNISDCPLSYPEIRNKWSTFFQYIQSPSSKFIIILKYLRATHSSPLKNSVKLFEDRYAHYSKKEAGPGAYYEKWIIVVDYVAITRFPMTLIITHEPQKYLPPWILSNTDRTIFIKDFTVTQNSVLVAFSSLGKLERATVKNILFFDLLCFWVSIKKISACAKET
ncbi:protein LEG1 homolog [Dipodomys merriami]|uniref:protein LEG1 homolog n=1 Tax=Dipodomys merriami TaxID=94247 RepID=UPI003855C3C5